MILWIRAFNGANIFYILAAINQQTQGLSFDLNVARFRQNGNCGYVLKPALLRDPKSSFNPLGSSQISLPGITPQMLQIKVTPHSALCGSVAMFLSWELFVWF